MSKHVQLPSEYISFPFGGRAALSHKAHTETILTDLNTGFYTNQRLYAPDVTEQALSPC